MNKMIVYKKGNIFASKSKVLVNPVNTVGVMGAGLALAFKQNFPTMYKKYRKSCENNGFAIGQLQLINVGSNGLRIMNFPTKQHFKNPSKLEYIEAGLQRFVETYKEKEIESIAFPKLGAGLGGLDWELEVKPLMEKYLSDLESITIEIYE